MVVSLAIWSGFTALCGLATDINIGTIIISASSFLLVARMGVGLGEAGGIAACPRHDLGSLRERETRPRARALLRRSLRRHAARLLSRRLAERSAELAPGLLRRRHSRRHLRDHRLDHRARTGARPVRRNAVGRQAHLRHSRSRKLWSLKAFPYYAIATGAGTFVTYGLGNWMPSFMPRTYGIVDPASLARR